jgi:hypothetical protein
VLGPVGDGGPRPLRCVCLIGVNLRIDDRHRRAPPRRLLGTLPQNSRSEDARVSHQAPVA